MLYYSRQELRENPATVAVVGAGDYGTGLICQLECIDLLRNGLIVDRDREQLEDALRAANIPEDRVVWAKTSGDVNVALKTGKVAVGDDVELVPKSSVDVVVDCTGSIEAGSRLAYDSILNGKHVIEVNVEMDVLLGAYLAELARRIGVVYTAADGDQPSLATSLVCWAESIGLSVVMAGKGTALYSEREAQCRIDAGVSWSTVAYLDGSKSQIEMASIANMTGLALDTVGFHKPLACAEEALEMFAPGVDNSILSRTGVVDFINCRNSDGSNRDARLSGGVFIIVTSENKRVLKLMNDKGALVSKDGKRVMIYRSHHLCGVETPWSILEALVHGDPTGSPQEQRQAEVVAVAKRDLSVGECLDGLGGALVKGIAYPAKEQAGHGLLPIGLADKVVLKSPILKGDPIKYSHLREQGNTFAWHLRGLQDETLPKSE